MLALQGRHASAWLPILFRNGKPSENIGLTKSQAAEFAATTEKARGLLIDQAETRQRCKVATRQVEQVMRQLRIQVGDAARSVRAFAELQPSPAKVYAISRVTPSATLLVNIGKSAALADKPTSGTRMADVARVPLLSSSAITCERSTAPGSAAKRQNIKTSKSQKAALGMPRGEVRRGAGAPANA